MNQGRRRRNGQIDRKRMVCAHCLQGNCMRCVDTVRIAWSMEPICTCTAKGHGGEPVEQQIEDPFTGDVHAPGMVIKKDGEVERK